jgi:leader peptidase (prepilin peptidase) / N-methyltransferase
MNALFILILIAVSLSLGSFLNVVIHRLPRGESLVTPGSSCPACGKPIRFYDNIPLFSFLILNGKCRRCGAPISWRYPIVEALTALIIMSLFAVYGWSWHFLAFGILMLFLIPISFIDLETGFIPDKLSIPAFLIGIIFVIVFQIVNWKSALIGAVSGGALLLLLMVLGKAVFKKDAMGMGDVKLLVFIGVYVGFPAVMISLFLGSIAASLVILVGLLMKKIDIQNRIPFGPFIAIGTLGYLLGGKALVEWYLRIY